MALINCPECGHVVSDHAETCPNCGIRIAPAGVDVSSESFAVCCRAGEVIYGTGASCCGDTKGTGSVLL